MTNELQTRLLEQITNKYQRKSEAVDMLSSLLSIGKDAVYRRLRGDTLLTPDEISLLAKEFHISLDSLVLDNTSSVFFNFNAFTQKINSTSDYLNGILTDLRQIRRLPDVEILYASSEIPFFYYSFFPELIGFKLYVFGRTIWDLDYLKQRKFHFDLLPYHDIEMTKEILENFISIDTTELWSFNIFDNTLNQIEYHCSSGQFENMEDALILLDRLKDLSAHMRRMAEEGRKFKINGDPETGSKFNLYHNEMIYTNNNIFVKSPHYKAVFSTFASPNFLRSTDPRMFEFMSDWFLKVQKRSNSISEQAERDRNAFYHGIERRIASTRRRIETQLQDTF